MARRTKHRRPGNRPRIGDWPPGIDSPDVVATQVQYSGNPKHKSYPSPAGPPNLTPGASKCQTFAPEQWPRLLEALREAIRAECVGESFSGSFPE